MVQRSVPPYGTKHNIYKIWIESQWKFISLGWNSTIIDAKFEGKDDTAFNFFVEDMKKI